jgi:rubredoxin
MTTLQCLDCGRLTTHGNRCPACQTRYDRAHWHRPDRVDPIHRDKRWRRLSRRLLTQHRRTHGDTCPGDSTHPPHDTTDLTCDHIVAPSNGGAPFDEANVRVVCRSANARKGARP